MEGDYNLNNFEFESIDAAYTPILKAVLKGEKVSPRVRKHEFITSNDFYY